MEGPPGSLPLRRRFQPNRLSPQFLTQAYQPLLPVIRREIPPTPVPVVRGLSLATDPSPLRPPRAAGA